jgi:hypothetical protein
MYVRQPGARCNGYAEGAIAHFQKSCSKSLQGIDDAPFLPSETDMRPSMKRTLAMVITFALSMTIGCRHQAVTSSIPKTIAGPAGTVSLQPDQVNTARWDNAWTNLLNVAEQSFTPSLPKLVGVEVELVVGNPGETAEELTLTVMDPNNKELAIVTQKVQTANPDHVMFLMPADGLELSPGQTYRLRLTGGARFGWKYVVGGYENGEATFNGNPLLAQARRTRKSGENTKPSGNRAV